MRRSATWSVENGVEREGKRRVVLSGLNPSISGTISDGLPNKEALTMERILLFIREAGQQDVVDFHPDEVSARRALATYVRKRTKAALPHSDNDDDAIAAYFASPTAVYTIVGVADGAR
jgi:hypothetical protein